MSISKDDAEAWEQGFLEARQLLLDGELCCPYCDTPSPPPSIRWTPYRSWCSQTDVHAPACRRRVSPLVSIDEALLPGSAAYHNS